MDGFELSLWVGEWTQSEVLGSRGNSHGGESHITLEGKSDREVIACIVGIIF
jgi:hypothetical protein